VLVPQAHDGLVPDVFGEIDEHTRIPVKGSWIVFVIVAVPAFFMDLEAITKLISIGNLFMYSFVTCCGIVLRYRERSSQSERSPFESWVWAFLVISFFAVLSFVKGWEFFITYPLLGLTGSILLKLCTLRQTNMPNADEYKMPLVPLLPCLGIIGNNALVAAFDWQTFINYIIFTIIGTLIYIFYSLDNSRLERANMSEYEGCTIDKGVGESEDIQLQEYNVLNGGKK